MAKKDNTVRKVVANVGHYNIRMITSMTQDKSYNGRVPRLVASGTTYGVFNKKKLIQDGFKNTEAASQAAKRLINR